MIRSLRNKDVIYLVIIGESKMAPINHSSGTDIIVPSSNGTTYRGLAGDDTYIISNSIAANAAITIVDTSGSNVIQLVDGLSIASSKFEACIRPRTGPKHSV